MNIRPHFVGNEIQIAVSQPVLHASFRNAFSIQVLSTLKSPVGVTVILITSKYIKLIV